LFELAPDILLLLLVTGLAAGFVDSIAGGGGLLALPMLLSVGLSPMQALATNKLQGAFGTFSAALHFVQKGQVGIQDIIPEIIFTFIGASAGTICVQFIHPDFLGNIIPVLLVLAAVYFLFSPRVGDVDAHRRISNIAFAFVIGSSIGFYDGFFGPGTGSFFAIAFVALLGYNLRKATAHTKVLNFTSNIASLIFFLLGGHVLWTAGLVMAAGQVIGARLGSGFVIKQGARLVRPMLVAVSLLITLNVIIN